MMPENPHLRALVEELLGEASSRFWMWASRPVPPVIRVNVLRTDPETLRRRLESQGFVLEALPLGQAFFRVRRWPIPLGNTLEHHLGYFYVQSLASLLPPLVLNPQPGERVLDLAAAPGSKTTQMAEMMRNRGVILANDIDRKRLRALANNVDRMGSLCVVISEDDGTRMGERYPGFFDRVLLDAPCSAIGTLHENREILRWWGPGKVRRLVGLQRKLILSAFDALRPGGEMVYATCTLTPEENEGVLAHLLALRPEARILPLPELPGVRIHPGLRSWRGTRYPPDVVRAGRLLPFENETEGFFLARVARAE